MHKPKINPGEFFSLLWLKLVVFFRNINEFFRVAFNYYSNRSFLKADLYLRWLYFFHNPFSISKQFLIKKGESDIYAYGETPLTTMEKIATECRIGLSDCVFELGCGRGKTCFWLAAFVGCRVVGIEFVPDFVERGNRIKKKLNLANVEFRQEDMCKSDLTGATVCYLYGTCLKEEEIIALIERFSKLPVGTKIITTSYPLTDYTDEPVFEVMKCFPATFTWGQTEVYLHLVK